MLLNEFVHAARVRRENLASLWFKSGGFPVRRPAESKCAEIFVNEESPLSKNLGKLTSRHAP